MSHKIYLTTRMSRLSELSSITRYFPYFKIKMKLVVKYNFLKYTENEEKSQTENKYTNSSKPKLQHVSDRQRVCR